VAQRVSVYQKFTEIAEIERSAADQSWGRHGVCCVTASTAVHCRALCRDHKPERIQISFESRSEIDEASKMAAFLRGVVAAFSVFLAVVAAAGPAYAARSAPKYAAIIVHADSGDVLFDRYADEKRYPASLTKMMTLYLLFEELEAGRMTLEQTLSVSAQAAAQPPSKLGLAKGGTIDVETAIEALVVKSANDVAVAVAESISGSEWKFAQRMTLRASELGMRSTTFKNASGLPNAKQMTTARDLATLSRRLVQDFPQYFGYFDIPSFTWNGRTYRTHNSLVVSFEGADGLKTGYTQRSGFNLATTAKRDGLRLVGVVLGGRSVRSRDAHMREILTAGFETIRENPLLIASLHRETPTPRLKPTLVAALAAKNTPALAANADMLREMTTAAAAFAPSGREATFGDDISSLIAANSDDFNEHERVRLSAAPGFASDEAFGEGDIEDPTGWDVQIGAYSTKEMAQQELEAAAIASGSIAGERSVTPFQTETGAFLYRARFVRLTETDAIDMCSRLKAAQLSCYAVQDDHLR
jgi:D-alanyl-D-alanine carboxypeptidase